MKLSIFFFLIFAGVAFADDIRSQPVHNLNGVGFCFNQPVKLKAVSNAGTPEINAETQKPNGKKSGAPEGMYTNAISGKSSKVSCSLDVQITGYSIDRLGACKDLEDPSFKYSTKELQSHQESPELLREIDSKKLELANFDKKGEGTTDSEKKKHKRQRENLVLLLEADEKKLSDDEAWRTHFDEEVKQYQKKHPDATPPHTGMLFENKKGSVESVDPKGNTITLLITDPNQGPYVASITCRRKAKKFKLDQMTIGDLEDAFGGNLRLDNDPSTIPAVQEKSATGGKPAPGPAKKSGGM